MEIYVDGSCKGNPGPGAFGLITTENESYTEYCDNTTNNRMEMCAIIYAMEKYGLPNQFVIPTVYTDSGYAFNTFTDWMYKWADNNWKREKNKEIENKDLVLKYYKLVQNGYKINLQKVKGHSGIEFNEKIDKLVRKTAEKGVNNGSI